jgi:hypothetical protein
MRCLIEHAAVFHTLEYQLLGLLTLNVALAWLPDPCTVAFLSS